MRKQILKIYLGIFLIGGAYVLWLALGGTPISCFYLATTGLQCPGCGISRMFLALLQGDIPRAFSHNPAVFLLLALWNGIAALCFWGKPKLLRQPRTLYTLLGISIAILIAYGILRNLT